MVTNNNYVKNADDHIAGAIIPDTLVDITSKFVHDFSSCPACSLERQSENNRQQRTLAKVTKKFKNCRAQEILGISLQ